MYLLDTDVISALRRRDKNIVAAHWASSIPVERLFLSAATVVEITTGIERRRKTDPAHAAILSVWLDRVLAEYADRVLPVTTAISRRWGYFIAAMGHDDFDFAIAATALEHDLIVVTRNVRDFARTGVTIFDPFEGRTHKLG